MRGPSRRGAAGPVGYVPRRRGSRPVKRERQARRNARMYEGARALSLSFSREQDGAGSHGPAKVAGKNSRGEQGRAQQRPEEAAGQQETRDPPVIGVHPPAGPSSSSLRAANVAAATKPFLPGPVRSAGVSGPSTPATSQSVAQPPSPLPPNHLVWIRLRGRDAHVGHIYVGVLRQCKA